MSKTFNLFLQSVDEKMDKICYFTVSKASSIGLAIEKTYHPCGLPRQIDSDLTHQNI
jgi:hypothetical protein